MKEARMEVGMRIWDGRGTEWLLKPAVSGVVMLMPSGS